MPATHLSSPFEHRTRHVRKLAASRLAGGACHGRVAQGDKLVLEQLLAHEQLHAAAVMTTAEVPVILVMRWMPSDARQLVVDQELYGCNCFSLPARGSQPVLTLQPNGWIFRAKSPHCCPACGPEELA